MDDSFFVDTCLLRNHVSMIQEERKTARRLYQSVSMAQGMCDPSKLSDIYQTLTKIQDLITYFEQMERVFEEMEQEAFQLHHSISSMLQESTDRAVDIHRNSLL